MSFHLALGNGESCAAAMVNDEYVFGHADVNGNFKESETFNRVPVSEAGKGKGRRARR